MQEQSTPVLQEAATPAPTLVPLSVDEIAQVSGAGLVLTE